MIVGAVMSSALSMRVLTPGWPPLISCRNHVGALDGADKATGFEINALSSHHLILTLANSHRLRGMRNIGSLSMIS